jgi:hypothetical protein
MAAAGDIVWVVLCLIADEPDVKHIFSTREAAVAYADQDPRPHIIYDYALDMPERHEGMTQ